MRVAVIGSSGAMGSFFARYLLSRGHDVRGYDTRKGRGGLRGLVAAHSIEEAVAGAECTIIATPLPTTAEVAGRVAGVAEEGSWIVEMMSVKGVLLRRVRDVVRAAGRGLRLLSIHPLFGPSLKPRGPVKMRVALLVDEGGDASLDFARRLLPDAELVAVGGVEEHDRAMGLILSLTHLVNLAYAATLARRATPQEFERLETPISSLQRAIAEAVLSQDSSLLYHIQAENPYTMQVVDTLLQELGELRRLVAARDREGFEARLEELRRVYTQPLGEQVERVYRAFAHLRKHGG